MATDELILLGRIWRAHGVHGEVKAYPDTDAPETFLELDTLYLGGSGDDARPVVVESARFQHKKGGQLIVLLKIEGVDDRDEAMALRGHGLYATVEDLPSLEEDEIYLHELVGFEVFERVEESGGLLLRGTVSDVLEAAQRLFVVQTEGAPDVLVPDVDPIVEEVDVERQRIIVTPPEGLF